MVRRAELNRGCHSERSHESLSGKNLRNYCKPCDCHRDASLHHRAKPKPGLPGPRFAQYDK